MEWRKCGTQKFDESSGIKEMRCHLFLLFKVDCFKNSTWHSFFKKLKSGSGHLTSPSLQINWPKVLFIYLNEISKIYEFV